MASQMVIKVLGFYVLKQDETGVCLTLGKYSGSVGPGLGFAVPFFQQVRKTTSSLQTIDLPNQQIVLNGNISVTISGNLNFRVTNPERALLSVSNYHYTMQQLALTTISDVLGTKSIEEVRSSKTKIADEIEPRRQPLLAVRLLAAKVADAGVEVVRRQMLIRKRSATEFERRLTRPRSADAHADELLAQDVERCDRHGDRFDLPHPARRRGHARFEQLARMTT